MYLLDQYRGTSVSCRYIMPSRLAETSAQPELISHVEAAIATMVLRHPVLQVGIADADSKAPRWVRLESLDLRNHIEWKSLSPSEDWEKASKSWTASQLDATYPEIEKRPGWKVVALRSPQRTFLELLFTWNHPHADGMSGKIFHQGLFQYFQTSGKDMVNPQLNDGVLKLPDSPRIPPPIEKATKLPIELGYAVKTVWQEVRPPMFCRNTFLANWAPIRTSPYKTQLRAFAIKNDILTNILSACRRNQTTLTGLMNGLMLVSLASRLEEAAAPAFQSITAVSLRPYIPPSPRDYPWLIPEQTMGNYVTILSHVFDETLVSTLRSKLTPNDITAATAAGGKEQVSLSADVMDALWSTAANVRREIERKQDLGVKNDQVGLMKFIGDWRHQMAEMVRKPRQNSWFITNLGVLDGRPNKKHEIDDEDDSWSICRAQFATSAETTSAAFIISPMTAAGGDLSIVGTWQECIFDVRFGEQVMADLEAWLLQIGAKSS